MMVDKDALLSFFADICVNNLSDSIVNKCLELCQEHNIDEEELVETWTAFSAMHLGFSSPTVDTLIRMEKEMLTKKSSNQRQPSSSNSKKMGGVLQNNKNLASSSGHKTPQRARNEYGNLDASPGFSPASYSPAIITPSSKSAAQSSASGKVLCEFGSKSEVDWNGTKTSVSISLLPCGSEPLTTPQHFMYEPLHVSRAVLCDRVEQFGNQIVKKNNLAEPSSLDDSSLEEVIVVGRISCDAEDSKLTANSVVLVGATEKHDVPVSLQKLPAYSLFPGQVVALKTQQQNNKLWPSELYCSAIPPEPQQPITISNDGPLQFVVASGPYTHSDSMTYEPLHALFEYVKLHKPQVLIMTGPFLDENHKSVQSGVLDFTYEDYFQRLLDNMLLKLEGLTVHVIMVASEKDAHQSKVYPTPPYVFPAPLKKAFPAASNFTMAPDPCLLSINGVVFGVTSTDILMHLGRCEVASQSTDRLGRLASHILHQATFYPVFPPQCSLHLELWEKFAQLPVKPHVLVLPSDLRSFIKDVEGTLTINPERLAKGAGSGSFARIEIHQPTENKPFLRCVNAQVIKI